jgi:hypothetical protein
MTEPVTAEVGWAIWSKQAGTRDDYSVLACSDTFPKTGFAKIISRFTPGTPDTRAGQGAGALPWVTLSWVGTDDALRLGLAITDLGDHQVDGVGRPISRTRYFCVPYDQVKGEALSYTALYHAVDQVTSFPDDGQPLSLAIPRLTAADVLASVIEDSKIDERVIAAAAALLLDGNVSVVQADGSTVEERRAFLDAVTSLLPYGYRTKFTGGTWADSGVRHRLRLAFAVRPKDDAAGVSWRQGGEAPPGDGVGRRYFDEFRLLTDDGIAGQPFSAIRVAEIMAKETDPQKFEQPEPALTVLRDIGLPQRVRRSIRNEAPVEPADLRRVFATGRLAELDPPRTDLLTELGKVGTTQDWPLIVSNLHEADADRGALARTLGYFGTRMLWSSRPEEDAVRQCQQLAASHGLGDNMLANLVRMPASAAPGAGRDTSIRIVADLVNEAIFGTGGAREYQFTREQLAANPVVGAEVMAALAPAGRAADLLGLLTPALPAPMTRVFEFALRSKRGKVPADDIAELSLLGDDCIRAALRAAFATGQLDSLLPPFTGWLATRGPAAKDDRGVWQQALAGLARGAQQRACLDIALLSIGAAPAALPPPVGHPDYPDYAQHFARTWKQLAAYERFPCETCVHALARYLDGQPWTASRQQAQAVAELADRIEGYDQGNVLIGTLASGYEATPAAKGWDFAQRLLEWMRKHDPDAVRNGVLVTMAGLLPGTAPDKMAELCLRAARRKVKPEAAIAALARSGAVDSPAVAANLLMDLRMVFDGAEMDVRLTDDWQGKLVNVIVAGGFSGQRADFSREVRELVSRFTLAEMWAHFQLLSTLTMSSRDGQYELVDDEREGLARLAEEIDGFVRKSVRRQSLWRSR